MPMNVAITGRYLFVSVATTALIYAGLENAAARVERVGIVTCGWEGKPCELAPIVVTARGSSNAVALAPEAAR